MTSHFYTETKMYHHSFQSISKAITNISPVILQSKMNNERMLIIIIEDVRNEEKNTTHMILLNLSSVFRLKFQNKYLSWVLR